MSEIVPPHVSGSAAQAGYVQSEAARQRDAARSGEVSAARRNVKAIDDAGNTIETSDDDTQVFTDAEGAGGQGRADEESGGQESGEQADDTNASGVSRDDDGRLHVDVHA